MFMGGVGGEDNAEAAEDAEGEESKFEILGVRGNAECWVGFSVSDESAAARDSDEADRLCALPAVERCGAGDFSDPSGLQSSWKSFLRRADSSGVMPNCLQTRAPMSSQVRASGPRWSQGRPFSS
jgi:hypothetical protein